MFCGALTRSTFAFGEAVVAMPLLAMLPIGLHTAVPLVGLVGLSVALITMVFRGWRNIVRTELVPLATASLLGVPVGLILLRTMPAGPVLAALGAVLVLYGGYSLAQELAVVRTARPGLSTQRWAPAFGFLSGLLGSAYNFNGAPVAVYGSLRGWDPERFRGTLQTHFLVTGLLIVAGQGLSGLWTADVVKLYLLSTPIIALAVVVGAWLRQRLPVAPFRRYVLGLIMVLGALMLVKVT